MISQLLLGGAVWLASLAAAGWWAYNTGRDVELATQYREGRAAIAAADSAASAAAAAISRIEVRNVTVRQTLEREIRTHTVYAECRHSPDGLRAVNAALGAEQQPEPAGGGQLPAAAAAGR